MQVDENGDNIVTGNQSVTWPMVYQSSTSFGTYSGNGSGTFKMPNGFNSPLMTPSSSSASCNIGDQTADANFI